MLGVAEIAGVQLETKVGDRRAEEDVVGATGGEGQSSSQRPAVDATHRRGELSAGQAGP